VKAQGQEGLPEVQAMAAGMLPGLYQARWELNLSIRILEYFNKHVVRDTKTDTVTINAPAPEDLRKDARRFLALLCHFENLQKQPS
jgi:hypothetical protein